MTKIINVVGYLRVSTAEQSEGFSLDAQEHEIRTYCTRNGYNLLRIYRDEGISGTSIEERINFQTMLHDISEDSSIHAVLVWKLSRLTRKLSHLLNIVDLLEQFNTGLIVTHDNLDTSTSFGKAIISMSGIFAEMERENIVSACKLGMRQRAREGKWNGGRVLGYRTNSKKELEINEEEAIVVREIFNLFVNENWGYKKIASTLNHRGLKTVRGKEWSINGVKQIIDNPIYVGMIRWGVHEFWNKKRRAGKTDNFVLVQGNHIPIITEETWNKAKAVRKVRGKKPEKTYEGNFLLTGLLKCPTCGSSMVSQRVKKYKKPGEYYRYYACGNNINKGPTSCNSNLVYADYAEKSVLNKIQELVSSPEIINSIINKMQKHSETDTKPLNEEIKNLKQDLERIKAKKDENFKLNLENKLSTHILFQQLEFLDERERETKEKLYKYKMDINNLQSQSLLNPNALQHILSEFIQVFETGKLEQRKRLLHSIIDNITVSPGDSPNERTINDITLVFEPQEIEALSFKKSFEATYGTVPPD
ncbi:recombinase family protein [Fictibacillus iocasae]|uniref:Recombinase family protein n=1 Tax=Fictibacillus iocasae TaxID=2715437 RepID=A0ABW2NRS6_9BACL